MQFSMQFTVVVVVVVVVMEPDGRERPHVLHTPPHPVIHPIPSNPIPSEMEFFNLHIYMSAVSFVVCCEYRITNWEIFCCLYKSCEYQITNWEEGNFSCWRIIYFVENGFEKDKSSRKYQDFGFLMICCSRPFGTEQYDKGSSHGRKSICITGFIQWKKVFV